MDQSWATIISVAFGVISMAFGVIGVRMAMQEKQSRADFQGFIRAQNWFLYEKSQPCKCSHPAGA